MEFDQLAINTIVMTTQGGINTCDIPYSENIEQFNEDYLNRTAEASKAKKRWKCCVPRNLAGNAKKRRYVDFGLSDGTEKN